MRQLHKSKHDTALYPPNTFPKKTSSSNHQVAGEYFTEHNSAVVSIFACMADPYMA
ncbi:MAG: hypothetical protein OEM38_00320 [Gammaproteobacteria bacterium]|nr:hypothetical protein [Gammaproteobacteria bacterium]